jgi:hypothetical protein
VAAATVTPARVAGACAEAVRGGRGITVRRLWRSLCRRGTNPWPATPVWRPPCVPDRLHDRCSPPPSVADHGNCAKTGAVYVGCCLPLGLLQILSVGGALRASACSGVLAPARRPGGPLTGLLHDYPNPLSLTHVGGGYSCSGSGSYRQAGRRAGAPLLQSNPGTTLCVFAVVRSVAPPAAPGRRPRLTNLLFGSPCPARSVEPRSNGWPCALG